ncbi:hypothetical protein [Fodinicurvata sediminis]|uniref:hypothetical protein n=1 Tax=Fodinicurvata sediminis TaxID=1121832 RepID=UPI0003B58447|nr:hypothetical protein [Fodinicurvata sediminis]
MANEPKPQNANAKKATAKKAPAKSKADQQALEQAAVRDALIALGDLVRSLPANVVQNQSQGARQAFLTKVDTLKGVRQ